MDNVKTKALTSEYLRTAAVIGILAAVYLGWRGFLGHESIIALFQRLF